MGFFSFFNRPNNFSVLATNISFVYVSLKKNYGTQLDGRQLLVATAVIILQDYIQKDIYSLNYIKSHLLNSYLIITGPDDELGEITDDDELVKITTIVMVIECLIHSGNFKDIDRNEIMNVVRSERESIEEAIKKVILNPIPNSTVKKGYLLNIHNFMSSPHLLEFRQEIGIK